MNASTLSLVPFQQASLCLDCEMITAAHTHCSVCGSVALLNLARTLNGSKSIGIASQVVMPVANGSAQTGMEQKHVPRCRRQRRPLPERESLYASTIAAETRHNGSERQSLREVAAVIYRVISICWHSLAADRAECHGGISSSVMHSSPHLW